MMDLREEMDNAVGVGFRCRGRHPARRDINVIDPPGPVAKHNETR